MSTEQTTTRTYTVPDMSCDHCKQTIETKVQPVPGVETVDIDVEAKTVTVTGGDPTAIQAAISDAGYAVV